MLENGVHQETMNQPNDDEQAGQAVEREPTLVVRTNAATNDRESWNKGPQQQEHQSEQSDEPKRVAQGVTDRIRHGCDQDIVREEQHHSCYRTPAMPQIHTVEATEGSL